MNTTEVVMKIRPEKIQALTRFEAMTSGLIFTTARVVIITAKIAFIFNMMLLVSLGSLLKQMLVLPSSK